MTNYYHDIEEPKPPKPGETKRLLIIAFSLTVALPIAIVSTAISLRGLGIKTEVESMEAAIKNVKTDLVEKNDCEDGVQGYYEFQKEENKKIKDQIVICTNNFSKSADDYPALLKHEMTHIMHACLGTTINSPDEIRELRKELKRKRESSYRNIHGLYAEKNHFMEVEARWMELQDYKYVNNELGKHCVRGWRSFQ